MTSAEGRGLPAPGPRQPSHPLAGVHPITLDLIREAEFLVTEVGCIYRQCFDEFGRDVGPTLRMLRARRLRTASERLGFKNETT